MPGVNKEQIARAKEWDLLSYMQQYEPDELVRTGPHEYSTATHGSLKISNGKWHWFKEDIGGKDRSFIPCPCPGHGFRGGSGAAFGRRSLCAALAPLIKSNRAKRFACRNLRAFSAHVLSYLQKRGIGGEIIQACIQANILYESRQYGNCVFVGLDPAGIARYAALRGTYGDFK